MLLATMSVAAQAAEMILYENPSCKGHELTVRGNLPDINTSGFATRGSTWVGSLGIRPVHPTASNASMAASQ